MISILLPAFQSEDLLRRVFLKGVRNTRVPGAELIIYDNGGNGDLSALASETTIILGNGKNVGLNIALNECAKVARNPYFYLPHTDMYLMPSWDVALLEVAQQLENESFLLCSRSIEPAQGHTAFHIIRDYGRSAVHFNEKKLLEDFREHADEVIVTGYRMPFFLHRDLWMRMGGVDPRYFSFCSDDDLVQSAYDAGVRRYGMVFGSLVYHLQGKSNSEQTVDRGQDWPYEYFIQKWSTKYTDAQSPDVWHAKLIPPYQRVR